MTWRPTFLSDAETETFYHMEVCVLVPVRTTGPTCDSANQAPAIRSTCVQRRFRLSPVQLLGHRGFSSRSDCPELWFRLIPRFGPGLSHLPCSSQPCLSTWFSARFCLFLLLVWFLISCWFERSCSHSEDF